LIITFLVKHCKTMRYFWCIHVALSDNLKNRIPQDIVVFFIIFSDQNR